MHNSYVIQRHHKRHYRLGRCYHFVGHVPQKIVDSDVVKCLVVVFVEHHVQCKFDQEIGVVKKGSNALKSDDID
jgi:hypothetical protein